MFWKCQVKIVTNKFHLLQFGLRFRNVEFGAGFGFAKGRRVRGDFRRVDYDDYSSTTAEEASSPRSAGQGGAAERPAAAAAEAEYGYSADLAESLRQVQLVRKLLIMEEDIPTLIGISN